MNLSPQPQTKKSRVLSTATPYIIPEQLIPQSKYLGSIQRKNKSFNESKVSMYESKFFKTKYQLPHDSDKSRYELGPYPKPKIQNKLHLQLPTQKKTSIKRYVGQQKQFQQEIAGIFRKIFQSCLKPQPQDIYKECDYCQNRQYKYEDKQEQEFKKQEQKELSKPYISYRRLMQREKQPIQIFFQEITNEQIISNRFENSNQNFIRISHR